MKGVTKFKPFLIIGLVTTFGICLLYTTLDYTKPFSFIKELYHEEDFKNEGNDTIILWWYRPWGDPRNSKLGPECGGCIVTDNRNRIEEKATKAVLFHYQELTKNDLPKTQRRSDQYYGFLSMESPAFVKREKGNLKAYDGYFNLTITFRRDGDITYPYNKMYDIAKQVKEENISLEELMKKKKHLVTWFASNCGLTQGAKNRLNLVQKLVDMGLNVDRRGNCFPDAPVVSTRQEHMIKAMRDFISSHKFFLAFENTHNCKDYITEKLYVDSLKNGAVPIVYGARKEDYEAVIPKKSAIFVDDFPDLGQLIDHIKYLDKNDTAYMEYLGWMLEDPEKFYGYNMASRDCELCLKVSKSSESKKKKFANGESELPTSKIVKSLHDWLYNEEDEECLL